MVGGAGLETEMSYCTVLSGARVFLYCGMHGVGSRVLLPPPPLSSSSKRQHGRPRGPKSVRPFFAPLPACGCAGDVPSVDRYAVRDGALHSKTFAFFAVCSWGPRSGCLSLHGSEGVRTGGRLHPGQAGERLLKQRPKVLRQADYDGLVNAGAAATILIACLSSLPRSLWSCGAPLVRRRQSR